MRTLLRGAAVRCRSTMTRFMLMAAAAIIKLYGSDRPTTIMSKITDIMATLARLIVIVVLVVVVVVVALEEEEEEE